MENIKNRKAECITLLCYAVLLVLVSSFHEPWFEENQAWQIARSASLREILLEVPHYEGHPPLWYLLLSVFAKTGFPPDVTLHCINITFCTAAMGVLLFCSPLPRIVRCALPFTYFFFYQYGVLSRPYCLMMLAFLLTAKGWQERDRKPWRYICPMLLLCLTSAYGILISGALCIHWTYEIVRALHSKGKLSGLWKDRRFLPLLTMLLAGVSLCLLLVPAEDCYYAGVDYTEPLPYRFLNPIRLGLFLVLPFDALFGQAFNSCIIMPVMPSDMVTPEDMALLLSECVAGVVFWVLLWMFLRANGKFWLFGIPYCLCGGFMAFNYGFPHHAGAICLLEVFVLWCVCADGIVIPEPLRRLSGKIASPLIRSICVCFLCAVCCIPILDSVVASVSDIRCVYGCSVLADFIKENRLEDRKIMVKWQYKRDAENEEQVTNYTCIQGIGATLLPYFDRNIFMNFNADCPEDLYMHYRYQEDTEAVMELWRAQGLPDITIGPCPLEQVYDEETRRQEKYVPIMELTTMPRFKLFGVEESYIIYMRESLLDEYPQFHDISLTLGSTDE